MGVFTFFFRLFGILHIKKKKHKAILQLGKNNEVYLHFGKNDKCNNDVTSWKMLMG